MEADRRIAEIMEIAELKKQNIDLQQKWLEEGYEKAKLVEKNKLLENFIKINSWVEFELNKELKKLEEKISILLSCKNCPENKGGYICQKEYEGKCLSQKTQYIKELKEEKAKLKKQNADLKESIKSLLPFESVIDPYALTSDIEENRVRFHEPFEKARDFLKENKRK